MKNFLYILLFSMFVILSCSCLVDKGKAEAPRKPNYPDKNLQEIVLGGNYRPENKQYAIEVEEESRSRGNLKPGESFEEKRPNVGKERFIYKYTVILL